MTQKLIFLHVGKFSGWEMYVQIQSLNSRSLLKKPKKSLRGAVNNQVLVRHKLTTYTRFLRFFFFKRVIQKKFFLLSSTFLYIRYINMLFGWSDRTWFDLQLDTILNILVKSPPPPPHPRNKRFRGHYLWRIPLNTNQ